MTTTAKPSKREKSHDGRMSLGQHLVELRKRLVISAGSILAGAIAGWFISPLIWAAMSAPVHEIAKARHASINYPNITAAFDLQIQVSIYTGLVISSPIWLYQIFAFLTPGLTRKEKKYTFGFFFTAVPLFFGGCAAGWFVLPHIVGLLTGFAPDGDTTLLSASDYFSFVLKLVLAIGIAFVLPVFVVLLNFMGVLSGKTIIKQWRIAILAIMVFTAIATPSADVVSMFLLALPLLVLYFAAAAIATVHDKRKGKAAEEIDSELADV